MSYDPLAAAESVAAIAAQNAVRVDQESVFPRATIDAARDAGLLALTTSREHGGHGGSLRDAAAVIERIARECGSSAMVLTMHYAANAVIEKHAPSTLRREMAAGRQLGTLAFSEAGSRSQFWSPVSTARADGKDVVIDATKSWVTSANAATLFVWSSRPMSGDAPSTLWLVPNRRPGLALSSTFEGMGLRGNDSSPVIATNLRIPAENRLGEDGNGFTIMMQDVLPTFCVLIAAGSIGLMETAVLRTAEHAGGTKDAHLPAAAALADLPTIRAYVARMRIDADQARTLWLDTISALESGRADAMLRVLEVKVACAEASLRVVDSAMRVCGGLAFRKEVGVERAFRDARAAMVMAPTSDQLYDFIGKAVCGMPLF